MMDKRLLRQFRMAQGDHSNRTAKQEGQQISHGNGNKGSAPRKLEEKEIVTDALAALSKAHQQSEGF